MSNSPPGPNGQVLNTLTSASLLAALVTLVEYLEDDERKHFEEMQRAGEDITDPPHIYLSIKVVTDWLDSLEIIPQSDGTFDVIHIRDAAGAKVAS
jgi:hypothetical protein